MFCPKCGTEIAKKIKWKILIPSSSTGEAKTKCSKCKTKISLLDESAADQEGTIEIIFH